jgi:hypothetical protein
VVLLTKVYANNRMNALEEALDAPPPSPQVMPGPLGKPGIPDKAYYKYLFTEFHTRGLILHQYQKLVKANLKVLEEFAIERIEQEKGQPYYEKCVARLTNIFREKEATITSLNIKALLCAVLFTEIIADKLTSKNYKKEADFFDDLIRYSKDITPYPLVPEVFKYFFDKFQKIKPIVDLDNIKPLEYYKTHLRKDDDYKHLVIENDTGDVVPTLDKIVIATVLGSLSLEDINMSLANNIYLIGLSGEPVIADGFLVPPISFFWHDLAHIDGYKNLGLTETTNKNVREFLRSSEYSELNEEKQYMCNVYLFILQHEFNTYEGENFPYDLFESNGNSPVYKTGENPDKLLNNSKYYLRKNGKRINKMVGEYFLSGDINLDITDIVGKMRLYKHGVKLVELSTHFTIKSIKPLKYGLEPEFYRLLPEDFQREVKQHRHLIYKNMNFRDDKLFMKVKKWYEDAWTVFKNTWNTFLHNNRIEYNETGRPIIGIKHRRELANELKDALLHRIPERIRASKRARGNAGNAEGGGRHRRKTRKRAKVTQRPASTSDRARPSYYP